MDIKVLRTTGAKLNGFELMFDCRQWELTRRHPGCRFVGPDGCEYRTVGRLEHIAWAVKCDGGGWTVLTHRTRNPFDLADIVADGLSEEEAVGQLAAIGCRELVSS